MIVKYDPPTKTASSPARAQLGTRPLEAAAAADTISAEGPRNLIAQAERGGLEGGTVLCAPRVHLENNTPHWRCTFTIIALIPAPNLHRELLMSAAWCSTARVQRSLLITLSTSGRPFAGQGVPLQTPLLRKAAAKPVFGAPLPAAQRRSAQRAAGPKSTTAPRAAVSQQTMQVGCSYD